MAEGTHKSFFKQEQPPKAKRRGKRTRPRMAGHLEQDFLSFVRARPCCVCGAPGPSHAHHHGPRGIGQKTDDLLTVPLCARCHRHWHDRACFDAPALSTTIQAVAHVLRTQTTLLVQWVRATWNQGAGGSDSQAAQVPTPGSPAEGDS